LPNGDHTSPLAAKNPPAIALDEARLIISATSEFFGRPHITGTLQSQYLLSQPR
jgi:hypothetical protein